MTLLREISKKSWSELAGYAVSLALLLSIPVFVIASRQKTQLTGEAKFGKPQIVRPEIDSGKPSSGKPEVDLVWPFLGKVGDVVLLEGDNFGSGVGEGSIILGGIVVPGDNVHRWSSDFIEFSVPEGAESGYLLLRTSQGSSQWEYPFTVYKNDTEVQVSESGSRIFVRNPPSASRLFVYFLGEETPLVTTESSISIPEGKEVVSVSLRSNSGDLIPFYVEPEEFGF